MKKDLICEKGKAAINGGKVALFVAGEGLIHPPAATGAGIEYHNNWYSYAPAGYYVVPDGGDAFKPELLTTGSGNVLAGGLNFLGIPFAVYQGWATTDFNALQVSADGLQFWDYGIDTSHPVGTSYKPVQWGYLFGGELEIPYGPEIKKVGDGKFSVFPAGSWKLFKGSQILHEVKGLICADAGLVLSPDYHTAITLGLPYHAALQSVGGMNAP